MKIAAVTDDGITISQHFGRALSYVVLNMENGKITNREIRAKLGHNDFSSADGHGQQGCGCGVHGYGAGAADKHNAMSRNVLDASVVIAGGMGWGAYESLKSQNIEPIVTDIKDIEKAANLFIDGKLPNLMQRLH